jgi:hypothetical protein
MPKFISFDLVQDHVFDERYQERLFRQRDSETVRFETL